MQSSFSDDRQELYDDNPDDLAIDGTIQREWDCCAGEVLVVLDQLTNLSFR